MKRVTGRLMRGVGLALACIGAGFSSARASSAAAPADLTAAWIESGHVDLQWRNRAADAAGVFVEYGNPGIPDFIVLTIGRPVMTTFRHRNVAPETTFLYRIRPYFGATSNVVTFVTGRPAASGAERESDGPFVAATAVGVRLAPRSLRHDAAAAAPSELAVNPGRNPTTVELRWQDRAADEDGYLVEMAQGPEREFRISALLPPGATSYRMTGLPGEASLAFRVRAFFYGESSNVARVTTPARRP